MRICIKNFARAAYCIRVLHIRLAHANARGAISKSATPKRMFGFILRVLFFIALIIIILVVFKKFLALSTKF